MPSQCVVCKERFPSDQLIKSGVRTYYCKRCKGAKDSGMKFCRGCAEIKLPEQFNKLHGRPSPYCTQCSIRKQREWRKRPDYRPYNRTAYRRQILQSVVDGYGGCCACCGESRRTLLTLDHVNGGGAQHRKGNPDAHYWDAYMRGLPPDYQVLCYNCNCSKGFRGYCPHEVRKQYQLIR